MRCLESLLTVVFLVILGLRSSGSRCHLLFEQGEVWKVCDFVRVSITIVVGRWNASTFVDKLGYCIEAFFILPWWMIGVPLWGCLVDVVHDVFST